MKHADSTYAENKRSDQWLKIVNYEYTDVLITGIRKEDNAFLLSYLDGQYAGLCLRSTDCENQSINQTF